MQNVKVVSRNFGYELKWIGPNQPSYIQSEDGYFNWYKHRKDAEERAKIYNEEEQSYA